MRHARRREEPRIRRGPRKKLRAALLYSLERQGTDQWLDRLRAENPEAAAFLPRSEEPKTFQQAPFHGLYWRAWSCLRFDRPYGAFGGEGRIYFSAIRDYAQAYGIAGEAFETLRFVIEQLDDEWLAHVARKSAEENQQ